MTARPLRIFMPCTGLGRQQRGFETFTRECGEQLSRSGEVDLTVFGGGGDLRVGERKVWNLPRDGRLAGVIGALAGRDPYFVEQTSFFVGFVGALMAQKPDLVYFADLNLGNICWHWRRLTGQRYRLLFYNGGPTTQPFTRCDLVQQVSPEHLASAITRGERPDRQLMLPHGVTIERNFVTTTPEERQRCRKQLGLRASGQVVLSVGALNASHKRMDYVIDEVATMPSQPHLLLVGSETAETPQLRAHASQRLADRCTILTLPREAMHNAYRAADAFVLAALVAGFGVAQVEASAAGLPCVAHKSLTSAYVLGPSGILGDLRRPGTLASFLERALRAPASDAMARHAYAYEQFSWDLLAPRYVEMFRSAAAHS